MPGLPLGPRVADNVNNVRTIDNCLVKNEIRPKHETKYVYIHLARRNKLERKKWKLGEKKCDLSRRTKLYKTF